MCYATLSPATHAGCYGGAVLAAAAGRATAEARATAPADVLASLTNSKGESTLHGTFLRVKNGMTKRTEFYFGRDDGTGQILAPGQEILVPLGTNHSPADTDMAKQLITTKVLR